MPFRKAQAEREACTKRNAEWWWHWICEQPEWIGALQVLQEDGAVTRKRGLPWRELAAHEVERLAGDQARARKYASRARRLEKVLPPRLRPLVELAVAGGAWLSVDIPPSRPLPETDVQRLQAICLRTLSGDPVGRTDGQWRDRKLRSIDPPRHVHVSASLGSLAGPVAVHATALESGRLVVGASQAGWLPVGFVTPSRAAGSPGFRPTFSYSESL